MEVRPLPQYAMTLTNLYLCVFTLIETIFPNFGQNQFPRMQNVRFPLTRLSQKCLGLSSLLINAPQFILKNLANQFAYDCDNYAYTQYYDTQAQFIEV